MQRAGLSDLGEAAHRKFHLQGVVVAVHVPVTLRVLRRTVLHAIPTVLVILTANFFLLRLAPGDAADVLAAESGFANDATMQALRSRFGLDLPVLDQLQAYLLNISHLSLGYSARFNMPVAQLIAQRIPGTLSLMVGALTISFVLGVGLGTLMAAFGGKWPDRLLSLVSLLFYSLPGFWIGLMLIVLFAVKLRWLPSGGSAPIGEVLSGFDGLLTRMRYFILPATSLSLFYIAVYARLARASVLDVRSQDYVRTALSKGLSPFRVMTRHVLRNALLPVTTLAGIHLGGLLGGAVVVETVFAWPGLGRLAYESVMARDFNVLLGVLLLSSILVILVNLFIDLLQAWIDPRIEVR
jgi:peptide/nickel transport system permease protein